MSARPTPGPWGIEGSDLYSVTRDDEDGLCASGWQIIASSENPHIAIIVVDVNQPNVWSDDALDSATCLVSDAFNVYHETQLTPRELADHRADLLADLERATEIISQQLGSYYQGHIAIWRKKIEAAKAGAA